MTQPNSYNADMRIAFKYVFESVLSWSWISAKINIMVTWIKTYAGNCHLPSGFPVTEKFV